jgi:hypothetical protein
VPDREPVDPGWGADPVEIDVIGPLEGTMVLAPRRPGSLVLTPPPPGDGWVPAQKMVAPYLYVPTPAGLPSTAPVYWLALPWSEDLPGLRARIAAAMQANETFAVPISAAGPGVVVLNGGQLTFAVVGDVEGGHLGGDAPVG